MWPQNLSELGNARWHHFVCEYRSCDVGCKNLAADLTLSISWRFALGIVAPWYSGIVTDTESGRRTHLLYFTYSGVLHSVTCLKTCHFAACFTSLWTSISVCRYVNTAGDVVTVLLIFAKYLSLYLHIFTCTYRGTHIQAHMYNQNTRGIATTRHRSLVERGGRKASVRDKGLAHTQKGKEGEDKMSIFTNLKKMDSST